MSSYTYRIRSQPDYRPFAWDGSGARHLLVLAGLDDDASRALDAQPGPAALHVLALEGACATRAAALAAAGAGLTTAPDLAGLLALLDRHLGGERMGLRVYAIGSEHAIWQCARVGHAHGLGREELHLHRAGTLARPVFCVHCGSLIAEARRNVERCTGCGRALFVRDHFSRLHGAYMGVQVDAEAPGQLPPIEEVYP